MIARRIRKLLRLLPPLVLACAACAGEYSSSDQLRRTVTNYNDDVLWGRYFSASELVTTEVRETWLRQHREWREDLRIAEYEVVDSSLESYVARVLVHVTWYRISESILQTTTLHQRWERRGRAWMLASEDVESGVPL